MRPTVAWAFCAVVVVACSGSSSGPAGAPGDDGGAAGDGAPSTKDGGADGPGDAQGGGDHDAGATDSGGTKDSGGPLDSGGSLDSGGHDSSAPVDAGSTCMPFCGSAVCGDDGCGGSCGTCPGAYTCVVNGTCQLDPGSVCGPATCGSAASCCHCNGIPTCISLQPGELCTDLGAGCM